MSTVASDVSIDNDIRAVLDDYQRAVRALDVDAILAHYTPDIVAYDAVGQLRFVGTEAYGAHWRACVAHATGQMLFALHDPSIAASGDVGFAHGLVRCGMVEADGSEKSSWMRATYALRRQQGRWLIVHEHYSVPMDMESGKASFDLQP